MMRKCHLNTCPVGVATQDPELRKLFTGKPEHIVNLFKFIAEELREIMAELGFRTINDMVGKVQFLKVRDDVDHWKIKNIDLSGILYSMDNPSGMTLHNSERQDHGLDQVMDWKLLEKAKDAIDSRTPVFASFNIKNTDRTVGTILSNEITKKYFSAGLPHNTINYKFTGSAGQSFGAFCTKGISFELEGEANDYVGKGLSGAQLAIYPSARVYDPDNSFVINCNTEMVDLDPLSPQDEEEILSLLNKHVQLTQSQVAKYIINDWDQQSGCFIKIFPKEYKRVLNLQKVQQSAG